MRCRVHSGGEVVGTPSHDGGQAGARHFGDEAHGGGDLTVDGSSFGVVRRGEARGDAGLAGGDGDVPGFEPGDGSRGGLDFFGARPGASVVTVMMVR